MYAGARHGDRPGQPALAEDRPRQGPARRRHDLWDRRQDRPLPTVGGLPVTEAYVFFPPASRGVAADGEPPATAAPTGRHPSPAGMSRPQENRACPRRGRQALSFLPDRHQAGREHRLPEPLFPSAVKTKGSACRTARSRRALDGRHPAFRLPGTCGPKDAPGAGGIQLRRLRRGDYGLGYWRIWAKTLPSRSSPCRAALAYQRADCAGSCTVPKPIS